MFQEQTPEQMVGQVDRDMHAPWYDPLTLAGSWLGRKVGGILYWKEGEMSGRRIPQRALVLTVLVTPHLGFLLVRDRPSTASTSTAASPQSRTVTYTHDGAGRLVQADYGGGNRITYTYDSAGNLLRMEVANPPFGGTPVPPATGTPGGATGSGRGCALGG